VKVLLTGGAGFIGSTTASACADSGFTPIILDNLSHGIRSFARDFPFYEGDIADEGLLARVAEEHPDIDVVIHFAAKIVVPESVSEPEDYYENNVVKTLSFLNAAHELGWGNVIFSSSASMYGADGDLSVNEQSRLEPLSPYARTKVMCEWILRDIAKAGRAKVISLRYFNPVGADPKLRTGLQDRYPTHALGKLLESYRSGSRFTITGTDWPTRDGSGIRDYIHVWDLALAHVRAAERFDEVVSGDEPYEVINLGTGRGTTVKELVHAFESVIGHKIQVDTAPPRPGDNAGSYTKSVKALETLDWSANLTIEDAIRDSLAWAKVREERDLS
jgi:UDP-glucose 4-epimerase